MSGETRELNLIGRDVMIQLEVYDLDVRQKLRQPIPQLPMIQCRIIKRVLTWTWTYVAELKEPLNLSGEGFKEETQKKMTAYYVHICPSSSYRDPKDRQNSLLKQLTEKGKVDVGVFYLQDPNMIPNEMAVGEELDAFSKNSPTIGGGVMTLVK